VVAAEGRRRRRRVAVRERRKTRRRKGTASRRRKRRRKRKGTVSRIKRAQRRRKRRKRAGRRGAGRGQRGGGAAGQSPLPTVAWPRGLERTPDVEAPLSLRRPGRGAGRGPSPLRGDPLQRPEGHRPLTGWGPR